MTDTRPPPRRRRLASAAAAGLAAVVCAWWAWRPDAPETPVAAGDARDAGSRDRPPRVGTRAPAGREPGGAPGWPEPEGRALWVVVDESSVADPPPYPDGWSTEGRALVRIAAAAADAASWRVGDRIALPLPNGRTRDAAVEGIDEAVGSRALTGRIAGGDGRRRRYVVTVGPASLFAYIDTPDGPYELVAGAAHGWRLPASSMMAGFDATAPDHVPLPDRRHVHGP